MREYLKKEIGMTKSERQGRQSWRGGTGIVILISSTGHGHKMFVNRYIFLEWSHGGL